MLQWEWLGGLPPLRRAAVIGGEGAPVAELLAQAGLTVDVVAPGEDARAVRLRPRRASPSPRADLPAAVAAHGALDPAARRRARARRRAVPPLGTLPVAYVAERTDARAVAAPRRPRAPAACWRRTTRAFARQLRDVLRSARVKVRDTGDMVGAELPERRLRG